MAVVLCLQEFLLPLSTITCFGSLLGRSPPCLIGHVPINSFPQALSKIDMRRFPTKLALQLSTVDGIATIMAGAVGDPVEILGVAPHGLKNHTQNGDVVALAVGTNKIGLPHPALGKNIPHGAGMILGMNPVANVLALAIELRTNTVDDIRNLAWDELLHMLIGTVVVRAIGNRSPQAIRTSPGAHKHVGGRFGGAVRTRRMVGRLLGELYRIIKRQVAVDFVGGNVMVADAVLPHGLQQAEGALDVGAQEGLRVGDGVVVVALGGVVHDRVVAGDQPVEQPGIADVAHDELHAVGGQPGDVLGVAGVGQLVQDGDMHVGVVVHDVVHEVAADEAAAARDDDVLGLEDFRHIQIAPSTRGGY